MSLDYQKIKGIISRLHVDANDYKSIIQIYLVAMQGISCSADEDYSVGILSDLNLDGPLSIMKIPISKAEVPLYEELCMELRKGTNMLEFFREITPGLIADEIAWKESAKACNEREQVARILQLMEFPAKADNPFFPHNDLEGGNPQKLQQMQELWYSANFLTMDSVVITKNKYGKAATQLYSKHYWPRSDLLADYAHLAIGESAEDFRYATRGNRNRSDTGVTAERGRSEDDLRLTRVLTKLISVPPHQVVSELFFYNRRNDLMAEISVAGKLFASMVSESDSVLVVGPSPDFILYWPSICDNANTCMSVPDPTIAALYNYEFSHIIFHSFGESFDRAFSAVLLLGRDMSPEVITQELEQAAPNATILALMPQSSITQRGGAMLRDDIDIRRIMPIPSALSETSPRKKVLLWASKRASEPETAVQLIKCHVNLDYQTLHPAHRYIEIPRSYLGTGKTLVQLERLAATGFIPPKSVLKEASVYMFSSEIALYYTVKSKGCYFCGRACYRQKLPPGSSRKQGKRMTSYLEKGLRVRSIEFIEERLERLILENTSGIWEVIAEDILQFYSNNLSRVSVKTIWACSRHILLTKAYYQEKFCIRMFCGNIQDLSDLRPVTASEEDYVRALQNVIGNENLSRYWKQLAYIFQTACQAGYLSHNPIATMAKTQIERERNRIREVRNALTKRFFTRTEMQNLISFAAKAETGDAYSKCVTESVYLVPLIRLFTGMSNREICALTWRKFVYIEESDMYQLVVSHMVADDGRLIHVMDSNANKLRCIPVLPILSKMLTERRKYLCSKRHVDESALADQPICLDRESGKSRNCTLSRAEKVSREAIQYALKDVIPNVISVSSVNGDYTIDLNTYYGDIFVTNFRYYARHVSKLTPGELCYILGVAPPDTYSAHYADYSDNTFQLLIQIKLRRWGEMLMSQDTPRIISVPPNNSLDYVLSPLSGAEGVLEVHVDICRLENHALDQAEIHIQCAHGLSGTAICV